MKPKWKNIAAIIGTESIETSADGVFFNEEQVDAIAESVETANAAAEAHIQAQTDLQTRTEERDAAVTAQTDLQTQVTNLQNQLATANQSITDLNAKLLNRVDDTTIHTTGNEGGQTSKESFSSAKRRYTTGQ